MKETDIKELLFKPCLILPLENQKGIITSLIYSYKGTEFQVRYYFDGGQRSEWFYDFEIEVCK
jgi:hypothetical protein